MFETFRSYVEKQNKLYKKSIDESVAGKGGSSKSGVIYFPTDYDGLTTLLSLIAEGDGVRRQAINWVMGEGLMQASLGREQLLEKVKEKGFQDSSPVKVGAGQPSNIQPTQRVVGEMSRYASNIWGTDQGDLNITVHDLFSREAWERFPFLNDVRIEGLSIHDYYEKYFEPKHMQLNSSVYHLDQMREYAEQLGLQPFRYGGFDGYIQFIEKGDWKPEVEKHRDASNDNQQFGFMVDPEKTQSGGEWKFVDDLKSMTRGKNPKAVYNFHGGAYIEDETRAANALRLMKATFNDMAKRIGQGEESIAGIDPAKVDRWKKILSIKDFVEKIETDLSDARGRQGSAKLLDLPNYNTGELRVPFPKSIDRQQFKELVLKGLDVPFGVHNTRQRFDIKTFGNLEDFGQELQDLDQISSIHKNRGWYHIDQNGKVIVKLNKKQKNKIY